MKKREKVRMKIVEKRRHGILSKLEPDSPQADKHYATIKLQGRD